MANVSAERTASLWMQVEVAPEAPRLEGALRCDTVVIGAGIAGLSAAYELAAAGQSVMVVDRGPIAGGMTSRTTAHLAPVCDDGVSSLIKLRGEDTARLFQESQEAAVNRIEAIVKLYEIACNFRRLDAFLIPAPGMTSSDARDQQKKNMTRSAKSARRSSGPRACRSKASRMRPCFATPTRRRSIRSVICAVSPPRSRETAGNCSPTAR